MILRISFKILKTHRRGLYLKQLLIYYNPINLIESKIGETTIDIFFPAKERKPSLSVWIRLQFPHSKVFNLTNVICISCVMIATLPRTPCDYCFFFINPTQHAIPTAFSATHQPCGDGNIMHIAWCTSVVALVPSIRPWLSTIWQKGFENFALGPFNTPIFGISFTTFKSNHY